MTRLDVRPLGPGDQERRVAAVTAVWGAPVVARRGQLKDLAALAGFVAVEGDDWLGLLTYDLDDEGFEVVTVQSDRPGTGVGRALMDTARARAVELGATRLWLSTTNDNIRAIRFYQEWGMDLFAVRFDGVEVSRRVKPVIPMRGDHGIPIRHELEFAVDLAAR